MTTASEPDALPYRLVVPQGWTRLPVDPDRMRPAARAMLLRRFADRPRDATAALRREVEDQLVSVTRAPGREYLRMLLALDLQVERHPVTATCLVSLLPQSLATEAALQEVAASSAEGALDSVVTDVGPHRAVVVVRDTVADGEAPTGEVSRAARRYARWLDTGDDAAAPSDDEPLPPEAVRAARTTRSVEVLLPVPDVPRVLLLSFSTSVVPLFAPLTELFLTIAGTVQWQRTPDLWTA